MSGVQADHPLSDFDFTLPEELIALRPARPRVAAKLLVANGGAIADHVVSDLPGLLRAGDLLVFNDTRVLPVRLAGTRTRADSVVAVEATLIERLDAAHWRAFAKPGRRLREGDAVEFSGGLTGRVSSKREDGTLTFSFNLSGPDLDLAIVEAGTMPLPPYIAARRASDEDDFHDYQTVFAEKDGAVAAPTAALHFDESLLSALADRGVETATVTLHVGAGTFLPVKVDSTADHVMHSEIGAISEATAAQINRARALGGRIISVGTTSLRVLETAADARGNLRAWSGSTDIFITPGYRFRSIDGLMTNFHLPKSTLFMLVSALMGLDNTHKIYAHAIARQYRFYSYGDGSLLLPH